MLTTTSGSAAADYLAGKNPMDPLVQAHAALGSYDAAFVLSAGLFVGGMILTAHLLPRGVPDHDENAAPVVHM